MKELYFRHLVDRYKDRIYTYATYFLGDSEQAKDVTQEVFIRFWQHLETLKMHKAKPWLFRVARNLCIDHHRRLKSQQQYLEHNMSDSLESLQHPDDGDNPTKHTEAVFMQAELRNAIKQLPEIQQSIIILKEIEGLSLKEVSQALETPINTVKVYLMRARASMRKNLQKSLKTEWV
ncbi:sigma-70 family RNA polymerase sigma factor [candidate division KSB1 bacterium]|nr:sigma-70 family RNA polymerase sigma factor [candidate division KSB1 bacterium]